MKDDLTREEIEEIITVSQEFLVEEEATGGKADLQMWLDVVCPRVSLTMGRMLLKHLHTVCDICGRNVQEDALHSGNGVEELCYECYHDIYDLDEED